MSIPQFLILFLITLAALAAMVILVKAGYRLLNWLNGLSSRRSSIYELRNR